MKKSWLLIAGIIVLFLASPFSSTASVSFGEEVVVEAGKTVNEAVSIGENVYVSGTVRNAAVSIGGNIYVRQGGLVEGDAVSLGGNVYVRENGRIQKNSVTIGGSTIADFGGVVEGELVTLPSAQILASACEGFGDVLLTGVKIFILGPIIGIFGLFGIILGLVFAVLKLALFLAIAAFVTYLFPRQVSVMSEFVREDFWRCFFLGLVVIVVVPFLFVALIITILGIPLIPAFMVFLFVANLYGSVGVALWVGKLIPESATRPDLWNVMIGALFLSVIKVIPLVGFLSKIAIIAVSFGVVLFTRFGSPERTA